MNDLMKPRYLVIADTPYPNTPTIGTILTLEESGVSNWLTVKHNDFVYSKMMLDKYPHLFRPLQWWEFRDEKDMPEYVKHNGKIYKVTGWRGYSPYYEGGKYPFAPEVVTPATETEYKQFKP